MQSEWTAEAVHKTLPFATEQQALSPPNRNMGILPPMTPYLELQEPKCLLYNTDVLQAELAPESVDLIVTSPPYNVEVVYGAHRDNLSYAEYLEFCEAWLKRCYEWLKPDGRMCLNIPLDKNKGGQQSVGADLTTLAKRLGFQYHSTIVWNEGNISRRTAWGGLGSARPRRM